MPCVDKEPMFEGFRGIRGVNAGDEWCIEQAFHSFTAAVL
jgi:hypothetical protein